jgi:hypothetical protein
MGTVELIAKSPCVALGLHKGDSWAIMARLELLMGYEYPFLNQFEDSVKRDS